MAVDSSSDMSELQGNEEAWKLLFDLFGFGVEDDLVNDILPDSYNYQLEGVGAGVESRVSNDILGISETIVNMYEAIIERLIEENNLDRDEFESPHDIFDQYATEDDRMEVRAFASGSEQGRTIECYDNGVGMTGDEAARLIATAHDSGTNKKNDPLYQGGHGKGSLVPLGNSDFMVVFTSPMGSDKLYIVIVKTENDNTYVVRNSEGDIPSVNLASALGRDGVSFFEGSGTMTRMINYEMESDNFPRRITGHNFIRDLGYEVGRIRGVKLIDMDGSEEEFTGSYNTFKDNQIAFAPTTSTCLSESLSGGVEFPVDIGVQKTASSRDDLYDNGLIKERHAGEESPNRGTSMKDLIYSNGPAVLFVCESSVHHVIPRSRFRDLFDNIDDDIIVFVDCSGYDDLFNANRDGLDSGPKAEDMEDEVEAIIEDCDALFREDKRRDNLDLDKMGDSDEDYDAEIPIWEIAYCDYDDLSRLDCQPSKVMEKIVAYWYNQPIMDVIEYGRRGVAGAEIALWIFQKYGLGRNLEMVHQGEDIADSVGDLAVVDKESGEVLDVLEMKISRRGGSGTRFNSGTNLLVMAGIYDGMMRPPECTSTWGEYRDVIFDMLCEYSYPDHVTNAEDPQSEKKKDMAYYLRDEVLDGHNVDEILENKNDYQHNIVHAARIKSNIEDYGRKVIEDCIENLTDELYEVNQDKLRALAIFLTTGIHEGGQIIDAMSDYNQGKDITEIINDDYSVMKVHIDDGDVSCIHEDTMEIVNQIENSEVVLAGPFYKDSGEMSKYIEIRIKGDDESVEDSKYTTLFNLQFNWRNIFQGITSLSIEGMEGEFF